MFTATDYGSNDISEVKSECADTLSGPTWALDIFFSFNSSIHVPLFLFEASVTSLSTRDENS